MTENCTHILHFLISVNMIETLVSYTPTRSLVPFIENAECQTTGVHKEEISSKHHSPKAIEMFN